HIIKSIIDMHLLDVDDELLFDMLAVLSRIGDHACVMAMIELVRNTDPDVHPERILSVTDALRRISDIKAMVKLLDSEDKLKILAANVLAKTGKAQGARAICERIFSSQGHVKRAMTDALAAIGGASLRETFHALLNDPDGHVISSSLHALGRNGDPDDISVMEPFLN